MFRKTPYTRCNALIRILKKFEMGWVRYFCLNWKTTVNICQNNFSKFSFYLVSIESEVMGAQGKKWESSWLPYSFVTHRLTKFSAHIQYPLFYKWSSWAIWPVMLPVQSRNTERVFLELGVIKWKGWEPICADNCDGAGMWNVARIRMSHARNKFGRKKRGRRMEQTFQLGGEVNLQ